MRRIQGSITIFLSLILLSILALICVCLESARAAGLQASAQMCAVSSLQSVLAGYDRILWEQYGLFFFSDSDREGTRLVQIAKDYAEKNGNAEASGLGLVSPCESCGGSGTSDVCDGQSRGYLPTGGF